MGNFGSLMKEVDYKNLTRKGEKEFLRDTNRVVRRLERLLNPPSAEDLVAVGIIQSALDNRQSSRDLRESLQRSRKENPNMHRKNIVNAFEDVLEDLHRALKGHLTEAESERTEGGVGWDITETGEVSHDTWLSRVDEKSQDLVEGALKGAKISRSLRNKNLLRLAEHAKLLHRIEEEARQQIQQARDNNSPIQGHIFPDPRGIRERMNDAVYEHVVVGQGSGW